MKWILLLLLSSPASADPPFFPRGTATNQALGGINQNFLDQTTTNRDRLTTKITPGSCQPNQTLAGAFYNNGYTFGGTCTALSASATTTGISSSCAAGYYLSTGTWVNGVTTGGGCVAVTGESNTYTSSKTFTSDVLGKSSVTANAFFGEGSHLSGVYCGAGAGGASHICGSPTPAGQTNSADGAYSSVLGGRDNHANGDYSVVLGGWAQNSGITSGSYSSCVGGVGNSCQGDYSTTGGGSTNFNQAPYGFLGGGFTNSLGVGNASDYGVLVGGSNNNVSEKYGSLLGGQQNSVNAHHGTVSGGNLNQASGVAATVVGGSSNTAQGNYSVASGFRAQANARGSFLFADSQDSNLTGSTSDQMLIRARGGVELQTSSLTVAGVILSSTTQGTLVCSAGTPSIASTCTDQHCTYTAGAAAANCTYTFAKPWPNTPDCICADDSSILVIKATASTTSLICTAAVTMGSDNITFLCMGSP